MGGNDLEFWRWVAFNFVLVPAVTIALGTLIATGVVWAH